MCAGLSRAVSNANFFRARACANNVDSRLSTIIKLEVEKSSNQNRSNVLGIANFKKMPIDFDEYEKWTRADLERSMMNAIRSIADGQPLSTANFSPRPHQRRKKRQVAGTGQIDILIVGQPDMWAINSSNHLNSLPFAFSAWRLSFLRPRSPSRASWGKRRVLIVH